ncbi:MAG: DUF6516 family protein [Chromatiaceae bacterium]|nr:DUF6516 family protein [Chromatiaceae bacterium]MCF7994883.1 DUF6516 family protein [Chromatiaceae bacterium]
MAAQCIIHYRKRLADGLFKELKVWRLSAPLPGSAHPFKYSLALIANEYCVLRYDNERGKGDHKHVEGQEQPIAWRGLDALLADFDQDIQDWRQTHGDAHD